MKRKTAISLEEVLRACYLKENINYVSRHDLETDAIELMWLEIKPINKSILLLGIIHRKPNSVFYLDNLESVSEHVLSF